MLRVMLLVGCSLWLAALPVAGQAARLDRAPAVGTRAPEFALPLLHSDPEQVIRVSELRGKPVVLVFGSYT